MSNIGYDREDYQKINDIFDVLNVSDIKVLNCMISCLLIVDYDVNYRKSYLKEQLRKNIFNLRQLVKDYAFYLMDNQNYEQDVFKVLVKNDFDEKALLVLREWFLTLYSFYTDNNKEYIGGNILEMIFDIVHTRFDKNMKNFIQPKYINVLMIRLADVTNGDSVFDPCMGCGEQVILMKKIINRAQNKDINFYGCEINNEIFSMAYATIKIIHYKEEFLKNTDFLNETFQNSEGEKLLFDKVITCPPIAQKINDNLYKKILSNTKSRFVYGVSRKDNADWLFIEGAISSLKDNGKAIVLTSVGGLSRNAERDIRFNMIMNDDILEAIIQVPSGCIPSNPYISGSILVFNKNKNKKLIGKVLFIKEDGEQQEHVKSTDFLTKANIEHIISVYNDCCEENGYSRVVTREEIASNDFNLNPLRYFAEKQYDGDWVELRTVTSLRNRGVQLTSSALNKIKNDEGEYYLLSISNIQNGNIELNDAVKIDIPNEKWLSNYLIHSGDILVTARGAFKCAVVPNDMPKMIASNSLIIINVSEKYSPYALKYYFDSDIGKSMIRNLQTGSAMAVLNLDKLMTLKVPNVPQSVIEAFEKELTKRNDIYKQKILEAEQYRADSVIKLNMMLGIGGDISG